MKKTIIVILLVVFAIGVFFTFLKKDAGAISFEYKFQPGQVDKYKTAMDMTMDIPGMPAQLTGGKSNAIMNASFITTQKVLNVNKDGSAKVEVALSNFDMKMNGISMNSMAKMMEQKTTMTISKNGGIGDLQGLEKFSSSGMDTKSVFSQMNSYQMPHKRINVGDTWVNTVPMPYGGDLKITSKLVAQNVPIAGTTASKIMQTYEGKGNISDDKAKSNVVPGGKEPTGMMTMSGHGVIYFSEAQGKLIETHIATNSTIDMQFPAGMRGMPANGKTRMKMDMKMHMTEL
jgi:hypothetical protein